MPDQEKGVYDKYKVERTDGRSKLGEKHHGCRYFVLDLDHDPHAVAALEAYVGSCGDDYPELASDLAYAVSQIEQHREGVEFTQKQLGCEDPGGLDLGFVDGHVWG